jgi:2,4-dienoyl-CoA reductase (NADPH2)
VVTQAVHEHGGVIAMQILHTGRYGYHFNAVSASAIKSPISFTTPTALSSKDVLGTIADFVKCAALAKEAGYDGVEVMGSEGYLINQFICKKTNKRSDEWGGSYQNRYRLPVEIVKGIRKACGKDFIIIYRLSMLDLIKDGSSWEEIAELALKIQEAGASIINTGIGWHEARIPTIATMVPRAAFTWVTKTLKENMKGQLTVPLVTTNRINTPAVAEEVLASGCADMVSMARPFLADPYFVKKAREGRSDEINTCIGCNQACLDNAFLYKRASCLVNPIAGYEKTLVIKPVEPSLKKNIAVIGAGPAGLAFATTAARRGHVVTLIEKDSEIGGQLNMAKKVPGKEEFYETLRYFRKQLDLHGVNVKLNTVATPESLKGYDAVVVATGVVPRDVKLPVKSNKVKIVSYLDVLRNNVPVGKSVAVIGAGGIGFDVSDFLTHAQTHAHTQTHKNPDGSLADRVDPGAINEFLESWGIDKQNKAGGLHKPDELEYSHSDRKIYLCQRKAGKLGAGLGKTTGWIHRTTMKKRGVVELDGCKYEAVNDEGFVIERKGKKQTLDVDTIVICAGQEPMRQIYEALTKDTPGAPPPNPKQTVFMLGGALEALELDAKRAIDQATRLAAVVETAKTGDVFNVPQEFMSTAFAKLQKYLQK